MTLEQRIEELELKMSALGVSTLADTDPPSGYYTSIFSGEQIDTAVGNVLDGNITIPSSTAGSSKRFKLNVNDSGVISATEVTSA